MSKLSTLLPFLFFFIYFVIFFLVKGEIPTPETLIQEVKTLYSHYGVLIIFLAALFEGMFLIGLYIPGSGIVLLGAVFSRGGAVPFPLVILIATLGFLISYCFNYSFGRYGWYHVFSKFGLEKGINEAEKKIKRYGIKAIFLGYFFPGSASFVSTACGVLRVSFPKFFLTSLVAQCFWSLVWGTVAYFFGMLFVELFLKYFTYVLIGGVIVWWIVGRLRKRMENTSDSS